MKTIKIECMFECPFQYDEHYQMSEYTWGTDTKCTILGDDCWQDKCPLKKEGEIRVVWGVEK